MLKLIASFCVIAALSASAEAASPGASCIDPSKSYVARPLNNHQIYAEQTMGMKKPPVRLTTSCYHLETADAFGLSAQFQCVGLGDNVVATSGSQRQSCLVTKVEPYAAQKDDIPQKPGKKS